MRKYIRLYLKFLQQYIKSLIEYRADFVLGLVGFILVQFTGIVFLSIISLANPCFFVQIFPETHYDKKF